MKMSEYIAARQVQIGDVVILYETAKKMFAIKITKGGRFHNQFGHFYHNDIIGCEYGSKITPRGRQRGWLVILRLSPQLWTVSLKQRTQILYSPDISMILQGLDICPGKVVVESGTGSGNLSIALINSIRPMGHLYTFEFNIDRVNCAQKDFFSNGMNKYVTCQHRDVCDQGLPNIEGGVDAIFLDLPTPWLVIESACQILRPGGRICCFSPCLEQVHRTCFSLRKRKFNDIRTIECLERKHEVITEKMIHPPLSGFIVNNQNKREAQNIKSAQINEPGKHDVNNQKKKIIQKKDNKNKDSFETIKKIQTNTKDNKKRQREIDGQSKILQQKKKKLHKKEDAQSCDKSGVWWSCRTHRRMRGHTGYLTFAMKSTPKVINLMPKLA